MHGYVLSVRVNRRAARTNPHGRKPGDGRRIGLDLAAVYCIRTCHCIRRKLRLRQNTIPNANFVVCGIRVFSVVPVKRTAKIGVCLNKICKRPSRRSRERRGLQRRA